MSQEANRCLTKGFPRPDRSEVLIAQSVHEHHQTRRHSNRLLAHADGKPFTDLLAEGHVMRMADLDVALMRGSHETSMGVGKGTRKPGTIGGPSPDELPGFSPLNPGCANRIGPDMARPVSSNRRRPLEPQVDLPWPELPLRPLAPWERNPAPPSPPLRGDRISRGLREILSF
jgi:hypothetical protein